jgi:hypothetical protein
VDAIINRYDRNKVTKYGREIIRLKRLTHTKPTELWSAIAHKHQRTKPMLQKKKAWRNRTALKIVLSNQTTPTMGTTPTWE